MSSFLIVLLVVFGMIVGYALITSLITGTYFVLTIKPGNRYQHINDDSRNPFFIVQDTITYEILDIKKRYVKYVCTHESKRNGALTSSVSRTNSCHILLFCFCEIIGFDQIKK